MRNVEVYINEGESDAPVGLMRCLPGRGRERVNFSYDEAWIQRRDHFAIDMAMPVTGGIITPFQELEMFPVLADSAPDKWGRNLMKRRERKLANVQNRKPRLLHETDYILGVADATRIGALRLKWEGDGTFQATATSGVPAMLALGDLLHAAERIEAGREQDADLDLIFAPGASLGGARPKCSVINNEGQLSIAKFPKPGEIYSRERWEAILAELARRVGINMARTSMTMVHGSPVLLSRRFDRHNDGGRIPYMSAMSMTQNTDGGGGSYLELVDAISTFGARAEQDRMELFRRVAFSILTSNTDDHLRNHGFLHEGLAGWRLSPAFDINPTSGIEKPRFLSTAINWDETECDIRILLEVAGEYGLEHQEAAAIVKTVGKGVSAWREMARFLQAPQSEQDYLTSAFEHDDLAYALSL